jgi:protein-tyrosine phosphatase
MSKNVFGTTQNTTSFRRLPLETLCNARDLGGFPVSGGGATCFRRFVRSELPDAINEADKLFLRDYGVTLSLDFRGSAEIAEYPSPLAAEPWAKYVHCPLWSIEAAHGKPQLPDTPEPKPVPKAQDVPREENDRRLASIDWIPVYITMAEENKPWVKRNFELIAASDGCVHYHCMTGKDRTGIFTAMLLGSAGVADDDIIADYSVSQIYLKPFYKAFREGDAAFPGNPDLTLMFYRTHPETMQGFLEHINGKYEDMRGYLASCGIEPSLIDEIADRLTA